MLAKLRNRIRAGVPQSDVEVTDRAGSGDHFEVVVVAAAFQGRPMIAQHRMVYAALGDAMQADIHALQLRTLTPEQHRQELAEIGPME